jgi:hypothetical protein
MNITLSLIIIGFIACFAVIIKCIIELGKIPKQVMNRMKYGMDVVKEELKIVQEQNISKFIN